MRTLNQSLLITFFAGFIASLFSNPLAAQTADDYHPFLTNKFNLEVGVFLPGVGIDLRVDGSNPDEEFDFDETANLSDNQESGAIDFRWRFGKKWSLWGQAWTTSNEGENTLEQDVEWKDVVFKEGTFVRGGLDMDIARVFFGRNFSTGPQHEFGAGAGLHLMDMDTFLEGEIIIDDQTTEFQRATASATIPLPNIGVWYYYSWSPKWLFQSRADWLSASIGDYSGSLWDLQVGVNYQAFKHVGFGLHYKAFLLDIDVTKNNLNGNIDLSQAGPVFGITANW